MRLIKFTYEGKTLYINPEHVESVHQAIWGTTPKGSTTVSTLNHEDYTVDDDIETVVKKLTEPGEPSVKPPVKRKLQFTEDELKDIASGRKTAHIILDSYTREEINTLCAKHKLRIRSCSGWWLQSLSHQMLVASGTPEYPATLYRQYSKYIEDTREEFHRRWDAVHPDAPWESDPEVTIIYFEKEN